MEIRKGDLLAISHQRKGNITVVANENFDTGKEIWWPVAYWEGDVGMLSAGARGQDWGRSMPCRGSFVSYCEVVGHVDLEAGDEKNP